MNTRNFVLYFIIISFCNANLIKIPFVKQFSPRDVCIACKHMQMNTNPNNVDTVKITTVFACISFGFIEYICFFVLVLNVRLANGHINWPILSPFHWWMSMLLISTETLLKAFFLFQNSMQTHLICTSFRRLSNALQHGNFDFDVNYIETRKSSNSQLFSMI